MLAGLSTACTYPELTETTMARYAGFGIDCAEVFLNSFSELEEAYLMRLRKVADQAGMRIVSVHPFTSGMEPMLFFSAYRRRFEDGVELYKRFCRAANLLGAEILVFHGNLTVWEMDISEYFDRFAQLAQVTAGEGVELCQENVERCVSRNAAFFREMRRQFPSAGFVLDVKQAVRAGEDIFKLVQAMGRNIRHIHISDHQKNRDCLPLGTGDMDIAHFLGTVKELGFDGSVVLELYQDNYDKIQSLLESYRLLKETIDRIA